jgi:hypothetical protein
MQLASQFNHFQIIEFLIKFGADYNKISPVHKKEFNHWIKNRIKAINKIKKWWKKYKN